MEPTQITTTLPDNAYKELREGEEYRPIMDPAQEHPEVTPWSIMWGLLMAALFSAAAAYSGLKIGQVFEAAIPIAILAVGLSTALIFDASVRSGIPYHVASRSIRCQVEGSRMAGPALPARHYGSVDVFLEAISTSHPGDVLVIDNGGNMDEGLLQHGRHQTPTCCTTFITYTSYMTTTTYIIYISCAYCRICGWPHAWHSPNFASKSGKWYERRRTASPPS